MTHFRQHIFLCIVEWLKYKDTMEQFCFTLSGFRNVMTNSKYMLFDKRAHEYLDMHSVERMHRTHAQNVGNVFVD